MSLPPQSEYSVPEETQRVARAIFPKGNVYTEWYEQLGTLFEDRDFVALFSREGQPSLSPMRLCLVLLLQFAEGLSDRQAADAVRARIDWKYLLCLELTDPGFHYSVLSEFRDRLIAGEAEEQIFNRVLEICRTKGLVRKRGHQRTDSTEVLAAIRTLNRLELVGETLRAALNALAVVAPDWMRAHSQPVWVERYGPRVSDYHLPADEKERVAHTTMVGADGLSLLTAIWNETSLPWLEKFQRSKPCGWSGCKTIPGGTTSTCAGGKPMKFPRRLRRSGHPMIPRPIFRKNAAPPGWVTRFISPKPAIPTYHAW